MIKSLAELNKQVVACQRCPRLRAHCREVGRVKRRAYLDWDYWGKPVPSFGDPAARLLIIGLAPGAHGANRTGRMFTGDSSGDYLYRALHAAGFANQPASIHAGDGLTLRDAYIAASARCAPPDNKPTREELANCRPFLEQEIDLLPQVKVVVVLGRIGHETYLGILKDRGLIAGRAAYPFAHNRLHRMPGTLPALITSYHPSRQNTSTGRLTDAMLLDVFQQAAEVIGSASRRS